MRSTTDCAMIARGGSAVLFGRDVMSDWLGRVTPLSLREFLALAADLPEEPPPELDGGILVSGLETALGAIPVPEAESFLSGEVRPAIQCIQNAWTQTGVVFGCSLPAKAFVEKPGFRESVVFRRGDGGEIALSDSLWGRSQSADVVRLERTGDGTVATVGYHVARIS